MTSGSAYNEGIYKSDLVRRVTRWMEATPHPQLAIEISPERVAGARFTRTGALNGFAIENLPAGGAGALGGGNKYGERGGRQIGREQRLHAAWGQRTRMSRYYCPIR